MLMVPFIRAYLWLARQSERTVAGVEKGKKQECGIEGGQPGPAGTRIEVAGTRDCGDNERGLLCVLGGIVPSVWSCAAYHPTPYVRFPPVGFRNNVQSGLATVAVYIVQNKISHLPEKVTSGPALVGWPP